MERLGRSAWLSVSFAICVCATAWAATPAGQKLSFAPYSKISARRLETMRLTREGKFDAVEAIVAPLQDAYERREVDEFAVGTAFAAFVTSDESLEPGLDRWVAQSPGSWSAHLARGRYLRLKFSRYSRAEGLKLETALGADRVRELAGRAVADLKAALAKKPRLMVAYNDLIELASRTRDAALFRETAQAAFKADPATWIVRDAIKNWGGVRDADYEAFIRDAESHAAENPLLWQLASDVALEAARDMWRKGQYDAALAVFETQAKSLDTFQIHKERARLLRILKRFPEAAAAIDHAIALLPGKYDGYCERAWLGIDTKQWAQAAADFRHGLEVDPLDPEMNRGLGDALDGMGDAKGAIAAYQLSVRWNPDAEILREIGWMYLNELHDAKSALAPLGGAVARNPQSKHAWYTLAQAYDALGDPRAKDSYARYLQVADPSAAEDREFIAYAKERTKPGAPAALRIPPPPPAPAAITPPAKTLSRPPAAVQK